MVDFILEQEFTHPDVQTLGKSNKASGGDVQFSAYVFHKTILYCGLSNGKIFMYKSKTSDTSKSIFAKGKDPEIIPIESNNPHKGEIRKMLFVKVNDG